MRRARKRPAAAYAGMPFVIHHSIAPTPPPPRLSEPIRTHPSLFGLEKTGAQNAAPPGEGGACPP